VLITFGRDLVVNFTMNKPENVFCMYMHRSARGPKTTLGA